MLFHRLRIFSPVLWICYSVLHRHHVEVGDALRELESGNESFEAVSNSSKVFPWRCKLLFSNLIFSAGLLVFFVMLCSASLDFQNCQKWPAWSFKGDLIKIFRNLFNSNPFQIEKHWVFVFRNVAFLINDLLRLVCGLHGQYKEECSDYPVESVADQYLCFSYSMK